MTPRSLFVLSNEHGQLGFALTLLRGQRFADGALVLLPDALMKENRGTLPVRADSYRSISEVRVHADEHRPEVVFFLSGHGVTGDASLDQRALQRLVSALHAGGCRVVTSDPLLGLGRALTLADVDPRMGTIKHAAGKRWLLRVLLRLQGRNTRAARLPAFEDSTHIYPMAVASGESTVAIASVFNRSIVRESVKKRDRATWLFLLTPDEAACQIALIGERELLRNLVGLARYTTEVGRTATVIAPAPIVERLASLAPGAGTYLPPCSAVEFEQRLLESEYTFYWGAFAFSQLVRLANGLPFFLFDRGWFARTMAPFYSRAVSWYFGGREPSYVDQRQLYSPYVLAHLAEQQQAAHQALLNRWQRLPTPDELVERLVYSALAT